MHACADTRVRGVARARNERQQVILWCSLRRPLAAAMRPRAPPRWWSGAVLPCSAALALFSRCVSQDYTFDDRAAVRDNPDVSDASRSLSHLLVGDFWGTPARSSLSNKSWRPLTTGVYRLVRVLTTPSGAQPQPAPYHALNLLLHCCVTFQLFRLCGWLAAWERHPAPARTAALAALLFATHPVHVEAVAGLVGAAELLCALLVLTGTRLYLAACAPARTPASSAALLLAALALALAATLAKETGITALGTYLGCEWLLLPDPKEAGKPYLRPAFLRVVSVLATAVCYLALRGSVLGGDTLVTTWRVADNHLQFLPTRTARALTVAHTHWRYLYLLAWPQTLCVDWNYACIAPLTRWSDTRNAGAGLTYLAFAALLILARPWRLAPSQQADASRPARMRLFLAAALVAAPLAPAMNVLVWVGVYLAERVLYLPSVGFCMALGCALTRGTSSAVRGVRVASAALSLVVLGCYVLRTALRVPQWDNNSTLFAADAAICVDGVRLRFNAGVHARLEGNCTLAEEHQRASLRVKADNNCGPLYELGHCAYDHGRAGEAVDYFERSLDCIDTVTNARQAARTVLSQLHAQHPRSPAVLLAYARITLRTDGPAGEPDACAAAGTAAQILLETGQLDDAKAAWAICPAGKKAAMSAAGQPIVGLVGLQSEGGCDTAAPQAVAAVAALPSDASSKRYQLATEFVRAWGVACRGNKAYLHAVNALQTGDPYNPHLHAEWARLLRDELTRGDEAEKHMSFALTVFKQTEEAAARSGDAQMQREARQQVETLTRERESWAGVEAGPRSVVRLVDEQLKLEL